MGGREMREIFENWAFWIFCAFFIFGFWIYLSVLAGEDSSFTIQIAMDENTKEYLVEHNYCILNQDMPFDSDKPSTTFLGECGYLNTTLIHFEGNK